MLRRFALRVLLLAAVFTACTAAACSSDEPSNGGSGNDAGSSGGDPSASNTDGGLGGRCAAEKTVSACTDCCGGDDSLEAASSAFAQCACSDKCKTQCASTLCATPSVEPNDECFECLDSVDVRVACDGVASEACDKDGRCRPFVACDEVANCAGKEDDPDGG
jgi:hypothetical protein